MGSVTRGRAGRTVRRSLSLALLCAAAVALPAAAQTPQAPQTPPKTAPKTSTLGGGAGSGKLLTRDELRACLKQQDDIAARRGPLEAQHKQMQDEKSALLQQMQALKDERTKIERTRAAIVEVNARQTALSERIVQWNARVKAADDGRKLSAAERDALEAERQALQREGTQLEAERQAFAGHEDEVRTFNARATTQDRAVDDWNVRNNKLAAQLQALQSERDAWAADCGDRRYREEDEIAIRRGQ